MKVLFIRIIIYILVITAIYPLFWYLHNYTINKKNIKGQELYKSHVSSFGNFLSKYFYHISYAVNDPANPQQSIGFNSGNDAQLNKFYEKLDWTLHKMPFEFNSNPNFTWMQMDGYGNFKPNYLRYWQTIRPQMQKLFSQALPPINVTDPVMHFRCSDVPFNKHGAQHLTTTDSVKWMAQKIKDKGYDKLIMLNCHSHLSMSKDSCIKYENFYKKLLNDSGIAVETHCGTILDDFAMMYYSPLLISLNASSYSFMAGIAKDPANYISCNLGLEMHKKFVYQTDADWILDPHPPLLHQRVFDYRYTRDVMYKLNYSH